MTSLGVLVSYHCSNNYHKRGGLQQYRLTVPEVRSPVWSHCANISVSRAVSSGGSMGGPTPLPFPAPGGCLVPWLVAPSFIFEASEGCLKPHSPSLWFTLPLGDARGYNGPLGGSKLISLSWLISNLNSTWSFSSSLPCNLKDSRDPGSRTWVFLSDVALLTISGLKHTP